MNDTTTTRETEVAAAINELALVGDWGGWEGRSSDVPSATDWLVDQDFGQIHKWAKVNRILSRYVCGGMSARAADAALLRVLG